VSPVRYEVGFYIPEDDILHSHCYGNLHSSTSFLSLRIMKNLFTSDKIAVSYRHMPVLADAYVSDELIVRSIDSFVTDERIDALAI
jgi:hypothetical protein